MSTQRFLLRSAAYLLLIKDDKVLLLRRYNTGWMDGYYTFVSGHLDGGETVAEAMSREAEEEIGLHIDPKDLEVIHTMHRISKDQEYIDFFLIAKNWSGEPKILEKDKADDMIWTSLSQLPEKTLPYLIEVVDSYKEHISFSESDW